MPPAIHFCLRCLALLVRVAQPKTWHARSFGRTQAISSPRRSFSKGPASVDRFQARKWRRSTRVVYTLRRIFDWRKGRQRCCAWSQSYLLVVKNSIRSQTEGTWQLNRARRVAPEDLLVLTLTRSHMPPAIHFCLRCLALFVRMAHQPKTWHARSFSQTRATSSPRRSFGKGLASVDRFQARKWRRSTRVVYTLRRIFDWRRGRQRCCGTIMQV